LSTHDLAGVPADALGQVIAQHRGDMSQGQLASAAEYKSGGQVSISRIENGRMKPSPNRLALIAKALGTTPEALAEEALELAVKQFSDGDGDGQLGRKTSGRRADSKPTGVKRSRLVRALYGPQGERNLQLRESINIEVERRQRTTEAAVKRFREIDSKISQDFIEPFLFSAAEVQGVDLPEWDNDLGIRGGKLSQIQRSYLAQRSQLQNDIVSVIGQAGVAAGAGAAVGGLTAAGALATVAALGTASTGTAIASLGGAAASSATLAWLGGGSLAAGGLGVAGGTALLTGIVALPVMLAAGAVLAYKGRQFRRQAEDDGQLLMAAEAALADSRDALEEVWKWMDQQAVFLALTFRRALPQLTWLIDEVKYSEGQVRWRSWGVGNQLRFTYLVRLAVLAMTLRALPVFGMLDDESDDEQKDRMAGWNNTVLDEAGKFLSTEPQMSSVDQ